MKKLNIIILGSIAAINMGCGMDVRKATVAKQNIIVPEVPSYEAQTVAEGRIRLPKVTMFLWKEDVTGKDVADVSENSSKIAVLEQRGFEANEKLSPPVDQYKEEKLRLNKERITTKKERDASQKLITAAQTRVEALKDEQVLRGESKLELEGALEVEISNPISDADKVETLKNQIAALESEIAESEKLLQQENALIELESAKLVLLNEKVELLTEQVAQADSDLKAAQDLLNATLQAISDEAVKSLEVIQSRVNWYQYQPTEIGVNFTPVNRQGQKVAQGDKGVVGLTTDVFIRNWDPEDGLGRRTFTSFSKADYEAGMIVGFSKDENMDWGSINNVTYSARGGKVAFQLYAGHGFSFKFQFARSDFNDPFERMNFGGDVTRSREGEADRFGVIKLSDQKN